MFLALPHLTYIKLNRPVVGKITSLLLKSQPTHYYCFIATKLGYLLGFNKISMKGKNCAARKV